MFMFSLILTREVKMKVEFSIWSCTSTYLLCGRVSVVRMNHQWLLYPCQSLVKCAVLHLNLIFAAHSTLKHGSMSTNLSIQSSYTANYSCLYDSKEMLWYYIFYHYIAQNKDRKKREKVKYKWNKWKNWKNKRQF